MATTGTRYRPVATSVFPGVTLCPSLNFNTDPGCGVPDTTTGVNTYNVYSVNQNFRAPYFFNYNLQIEKSLGNSAVFQIGYVGSEGRKLSTMLNINQVGASPVGHFNAQYPNAGSIVQLNSTGTSNYNSLQTTLRIRSCHGLSTQFAYTWAHALDLMSEYRGVLPAGQLQPEGGIRQRGFRYPAQLHHQPARTTCPAHRTAPGSSLTAGR